MAKKTAKINQNPTPSKTVKFSENPEQILDSHISWHFNLMDQAPESPWTSLPKHLNRYADKLHAYEKQTIAEIFHEKQQYNHAVPVGRLVPRAQARLNTLKIKVDALYRLRFGGKPRLWGILKGNIFQILWFDPQHQVCPSEKKHT
ncbi:hypothetical protein [Maridesulfovibrio sp.]|uniref:hypothetical protein n=1 Tax=Maridesulfovibrio sp. TaxID=2795000 RepID=UPI0029CA6063|nr:hypothetical protein [Maridesulfovibrio sp.]